MQSNTIEIQDTAAVVIYDADNVETVRIEKDGTVHVADESKLDDAAVRFWAAVKRAAQAKPWND